MGKNVWKINGGLIEETEPNPGSQREEAWLINEGIAPSPQPSHKAEEPTFPKAHAFTHGSEGNDPIDPATIGAVSAGTAQGMADAAETNAKDFSTTNLDDHKSSGDHDSRYYSKTNLQTPGQSVVDWENLAHVPNMADKSWKTAVANKAALPLVGNSVGDQRCVLDDGDGKSAMYACIAIVGTQPQQWSKTGDVDWASDEATRVTQENARVSAETARATAETGRVNAETIRVSSETTRGTNEAARITAETNRSTAETNRSTAETTRIGSENARITAETGRVGAENARVSAETIRGENETARISQEAARQTSITNLIAKGDYSAATQYRVNNIVKHTDGCGYICILDSLNHAPTNVTYWVKFAEKGSDGAGGDMFKSIYDPTSSGKVVAADNADQLGNQDPSYYLDANNFENMPQPISDAGDVSITDIDGHFTADNVEDALAELFTLASDGKTSIASAIAGMGQIASGSDAFAVLAAKISAISSDTTATADEILLNQTAYAGSKITGTMPNNGNIGTQNLTAEGAEYSIAAGFHNGLGKVKAVITNLIASVIKAGITVGGILGTFTADANAVAANILTTKSAYVNAVKIDGSMNNRAGDTACLASSIVGTTLKLRASDGYRDGVDDNVTITDANHIAGNIKVGVTDLGVLGTFTADANAVAEDIRTGKSGYVNGTKIDGNAVMKKFASGTAVTAGATARLYVAGLTFKPSVICILAVSDTNRPMVVYNASVSTAYSYYATGSQSVMLDSLGATSYVNDTGFNLRTTYAGINCAWFAIE